MCVCKHVIRHDIHDDTRHLCHFEAPALIFFV